MEYNFSANTMTDDDAIRVVRDIMVRHYGIGVIDAKIFVVWKCKTIQNVKFIVGTNYDSVIYELTLNGDKNEIYVDHYEKINKDIIKLN